MGNYVLDLFKEDIDAALNLQRRIVEIELEESDINIKIQVLSIAMDKATDNEDTNGFFASIQLLRLDLDKLKKEKTEKQTLHRNKVRRVTLIQNSIEELENQRV